MFIGIDGEGKNNADGSHRYTLLASSVGRYLENDSGLSTQDSLDYLIDIRIAYPHAHLVGFSVDYDINMMLSDFRGLSLIQLWQEGSTLWRHNGRRYYIEYIPSKHLKVIRYYHNEKHSVTLWDTWGFFQSSFVNALKKWEVGDETVWNRILDMKEQRGDFATVSDTAILTYCLEECTLLAEMVEKLATLFEQVGIKLNAYQGGGSAAAALLRVNGVQKHVNRELPEPVRKSLLHAYFGGRSEIFNIGEHDRCWDYDINSAYPTATLSLPSLCGVWRRGTGAYQTGRAYTLCRCAWKLGETVLAPFPYRNDDGSVSYYRSGEGWYHGIEADTALELYPPGTITVKEWWEFIPDTDDKPFAFVQPLYDKRQVWKETGDMRERPIKLALNSIYGKTAQGVGYKGSVPPYQSYFWAGYITAHCRATILRAAYPHRHALVAISTDGLFLTEEAPELPISTKLGEWDVSSLDHFFIAQPGVYIGEADGKELVRNRGFSAKEIDWPTLRERFAAHGPGAFVSFAVTRFVKLGSCIDAITSRDYSTWRRWTPSVRTITVSYGDKWPAEDNRTLCCGDAPSGVSRPYEPKQRGMLAPELAELLAELDHMPDEL